MANIFIQSIQTLEINSNVIQNIMTMTNAHNIISINDKALRLEVVSVDQEMRQTLEAFCFSEQLDVCILKTLLHLKDYKLVAMDMDSTLITIECIDEIADMQGLKQPVSEITEAAMRGEIEFEESLIRRVALLKGLDASALEKVYEERLQLSLGAEKMLAAVQAAGLKTLLVSGGFTFFTDKLKTRLNLDFTHANQLEIDNGKLTGKLIGKIVDAQEKQNTVARVCEQMGFTPSQTIVMGDGANDLKMMSNAGLSVAFRAKPIVRTQANVAFNFIGLDGLLNIVE